MAYKPKLLTLAESGTGAALTASNGGILYSNASTAAVLAGTSIAGQVIRSGASTTPAWSTATYPATAGTSANVLTSDGTNWSSVAPARQFAGFISVGNGNPADATTYYFSNASIFNGGTVSTAILARIVIPFNMTINIVKAVFRVSGTLGTSENSTLFIRVNDTTNTNISTTIQLAAIDVSVSNTSLGLSVSAGDYVVFGFTTPTWVTNPGNVGVAITFST